jgi:cyclic pyranopterin monophosphate synthase
VKGVKSASSMECVGLVARPVFKTGLRARSRPWRFDSPAFRECRLQAPGLRKNGGRRVLAQRLRFSTRGTDPTPEAQKGGSKVDFSHLDDEGSARMVDVGEKNVIRRTAKASGRISMSPETVRLLRDRALPKGDALNTARIAGVMAAKKTPDLIPLCHGINMTSVDVDFEVGEDGISIVAVSRASDRTGVEMEALTAVSVAALTVYDMCKAVDKGMEIGEIRLVEKTKEGLS